MEKLPLSALVAVRNEESNIRKCLASLQPAAEVVVVDSGSTDMTAEVAEREFNARVVQFTYAGGYPKKRQWALDSLQFSNDWILLVDADEEIPSRLWEEIKAVVSGPHAHNGYLITKGFHFLGRRFRFGGFSHSAVLLFRKGNARFEELVLDQPHGLDMEVHERVLVDGTTGTLHEPLTHKDFKGLEAYIDRHNRYSTWEAMLRRQYFQRGVYGQKAITARFFGNAQERRRMLKLVVMRLPFEGAIWFFYHYVFRLGFLEGWPGFIASRLRAQYVFQVRSKLRETLK